RVAQLLAELKAAQTETRRMRERLASQQAATIASSTQVSDVKGVRFVVYHLDDTAEGLRDTALRLRDSHGIDISVLGGVHGGRVHLVAVSSKRAVEAGLQAAQILAGPARL
ncbi:MAG: hypothetical protein C4317_09830, partial [Acidimicrobiia bacterium]